MENKIPLVIFNQDLHQFGIINDKIGDTNQTEVPSALEASIFMVDNLLVL